MLTAGADLDARARGGVTALHLAAGVGDAALLALLLAHGANVHGRLSPSQSTPADVAAEGGYPHIVTLLQRARR